MRNLKPNCKCCGIEKTVETTNTYKNTRTGKVYFKSYCKECDKAKNTVWIYENWDKHKGYSRRSMAKRKVNNV